MVVMLKLVLLKNLLSSSLLNQQLNSEKYNEVLKKVIKDSFKEYLESIKPHLSETQLQGLQVFFSHPS